jgi:GTP-binding protein Era
VIGRGGSMLKTITQGARRSLESLIEHRVKLILTVRVQRSWRKDKAFLKRLGLA